MPKEALLIIDYTNDFVDDNGNLTVGKPGQVLVDYIVDLAEQFRSSGNEVILPTDLHEENNPYHPETKLFPPHNLKDTWGREFYGSLNDWYNQHATEKNVYMFDKTRYSSFAGTDLDLYLRERKIDTIHLVGVCTEICVLHTAVSAYNLNYNIIVHEQGVAGLSQAGHDFALSHFKNSMGITIK